MLISKESYEAWMKMQHYVCELSLNIEHQLGWRNVWDNYPDLKDVFDIIIDDLNSQSDYKTPKDNK